MLFPYFQRSKNQRYYKSQTKDVVFVYIFGFIFYGVSHAKTDLRNKYMIDFMFGSVFEQDCLLNVMIKEFMRKDDLNVLVF